MATPLRCALDYLSHPPAIRLAQPLFREAAYRAATGFQGADALAHLAVSPGAVEAALGFSPDAYLAANPDLRVEGQNPLRHYLARGRFEGRGPSREREAPSEEDLDWSGLTRSRERRTPQVSVIVPVHGAPAHTLLCLYRLLSAKSDVPHRILVIDDGAPDARLAAELAALHARGLIELIVNQTNLGFSAAVNRGIAACGSEDVVLLNSDTEVFDHWLDRLHQTARSAKDIGTVTPMSNSATVLSYPIRLRDNPADLELDWRALDGLFRCKSHDPVNLPSAVGFCMYISRTCLDQTGALDATAFPQGYGEENDFCLRAAAAGWRHVAATNTFVAHHGAASFGERRSQLIGAGLRVIDSRYPAYRRQVDTFIRVDPLAKLRCDIDCLRIRAAAPTHTMVHQVRSGAPEDQALALIFDPSRSEFLMRCAPAPVTPNMKAVDIMTDPSSYRMMLQALGVRRVTVAERAWFGERRARALEAATMSSGVEFQRLS